MFSFCKVVSVVVSVVFLPALCLLALVAFPVPLHGLKPLHFLEGFEALASSPDPLQLQLYPYIFVPPLFEPICSHLEFPHPRGHRSVRDNLVRPIVHCLVSAKVYWCVC